MLNKIKTRTPLLALILFVFSIGLTIAATNKVVVIPMAGDVGISDYEIVRSVRIVDPSQTQELGATTFCPAGKKVLGGGGSENGSSLVIAKSYPIDDTGWTVTWNEIVPLADDASVTVYAICAKVG